MPNIKSAKKRVLVIEKKTMQNKAIKSALKTQIKKFLEAVNADLDPANIGENLLTHDTPLLYAYIFEDKPSAVKDSGDFYDYVKVLYEKHASEIAEIKPYLLLRR